MKIIFLASSNDGRVIEAGLDPHYDCRLCCTDESVCSIPQCQTGLTAPGCHGDQGQHDQGQHDQGQHDVLDLRTEPSYINEDLPSRQFNRQTERNQRPSYENDVETAPTSNGATRQFNPDRQMERTQRRSNENNVATAPTSNGATRQFHPDRQTERTQRRSNENNVDPAPTSNGAWCQACKKAVNKIRRAESAIRDEQVSRPAEFY